MSNKSQLKDNNSLLRSILSIVSNRQNKTVTPSSAVQIVSADAGGILGTVTVKAVPDSAKKGTYIWKKLTAQGGNFVNFVVSDSETAYPDGGTQGGHWYERVYKCSIKTGTIKPAYNTSSGFSISNPFKRKDKVKFVAIYDTKNTSAVRTLAIIKDFENNYQVAIASDSTYYSSVSLLDTHITVDDSEIKFVPYGNQADFSSVGEYRWEVVGYE